MIEIKITTQNENQRLDKYLLKYLNKAPKSFIYKMLRKKNIKLNGKKAEGNEMLLSDDIIALYLADDTIKSFKEDKKIIETTRDFKIIFEDENVILVYKPIGLVSQPDINNKENSLNDQLLFYMYENNEYTESADFKPSICNRLDRNTSGIVVFGKNLKTVQTLNNAFKENLIDKYYITAVEGTLTKPDTLKLFYKKTDNKAIVSSSYIDGSKEVITSYEPIKTKDGKTLLKVQLITGKTHQIRASFEHLRYPIIGDKKYNTKTNNEFYLKNQFLHCYKVDFNDNNDFLSYLSNENFICGYMDKSFKNVMKFFEVDINEIK